MKAVILTPPSHKIDVPSGYKTVFLAGSIEMGKAEDWQQKVIDAVQNFKVAIFNPRREQWDSSWEQSIENVKFKEQVVWELEHLEIADLIVMYLAPGTISPISLMEFGMYHKSGKLVIYCPEGFHRKGNIDVVCERYNIPQVEKFEELITLIKYAQ
jgi:hypothetical protein